jgi:glutamate N-acetyltransferase/amino-acid N-acetyltransferase
VAARSVADSPLVKTAVHGADPNWGRVVMAVGKSAAKVKPDRLAVKIGGVRVFSRGRPAKFDEADVVRHLQSDPVTLDIDLGIGGAKYTAWTCDLSREYIAINADYHT